ncbi:F-box/kelch-repeat protein [Quillaja saponaria]|uniref:F-box/kelch-repeat protein n=1 Tax=Quillaja saponaria TaxID=32244 RepID=A0AAD7QFK0_QUISA|nr:F-box/kelch-repeat protein [Quillaja saponaria]
MENSDFIELVPGLPEELGLECLTRLPYSDYRVSVRVCRRWRHLLQSDDFYYHRKKSGHTRRLACLLQAISAPEVTDGRKSSGCPITYGITVLDPVGLTWERLDPVWEYPDGLPLFCQLASCEGKLVLMGGWNPVSYDPVTKIYVYDFRTNQWRRGKDMPSKRSFFAIGYFHGRVYVAGGHDENKNALKSAWVYDLRRDEWDELSPMSQERDECEGVVVGNEFWVVSGYATESQGMFEGTVEAYEFESGLWKRVDLSWEVGRCPRSCVGFGKDGKLVSWAESDSGVRVGACGIVLGAAQTLVTGSEYQGAPNGFYLVGTKEGQNCKFEKISVPVEFSGFVQSGCCVEV